MHDDATMLHHPDALTRLRYVVHRLRAPGGCPWDMEQTHETLITHVIEEAYEVAEAIRAYWTDTHNLAEGAGAAPLAALLQERARWAGKRVGVVLCGGNIDLALFRSWVLGINHG
jgi:threonine dehydratase